MNYFDFLGVKLMNSMNVGKNTEKLSLNDDK